MMDIIIRNTTWLHQRFDASHTVMPGLDPGIHHSSKGWIAGSSPAMTSYALLFARIRSANRLNK
jgi:hypothetical protein